MRSGRYSQNAPRCMQKFHSFVFLPLLFFGFLLVPSPVLAVMSDSFEGYSTGNLDSVTGGAWGYHGVDEDYEIVSSPVRTGSRALGCDDNTCGTPTTSVNVSSNSYIHSGYFFNEGRGQMIAFDNANGDTYIRLRFDSGGDYIFMDNLTSLELTSNSYATSTWNRFDVELDFVNYRGRASLNSGTYTDWLEFSTTTSFWSEFRLYSTSASPGTMFAFDDWGDAESAVFSFTDAITNVVSPVQFQTFLTIDDVNFVFDYSLSQIPTYTFAGIELIDVTNSQTIFVAEKVLSATSTLGSFNTIMNLGVTGIYQWRPYLRTASSSYLYYQGGEFFSFSLAPSTPLIIDFDILSIATDSLQSIPAYPFGTSSLLWTSGDSPLSFLMTRYPFSYIADFTNILADFYDITTTGTTSVISYSYSIASTTGTIVFIDPTSTTSLAFDLTRTLRYIGSLGLWFLFAFYIYSRVLALV